MKKVARKSFKIQRKKKKASDEDVRPVIVEPLYYEEPPSSSDESSDVEYIEDDPDFAESVDGARMKSSAAVLDKQAVDDDLLALSVSIPSNVDVSDDSSCLSQEGVLMRLPANLINKSNRLSAKIELGPSLAESTSSEELLTQVTDTTCSETCGTSTGSDGHESKENKRLDGWRRSMEEEIGNLGENNTKTAASLLDVGAMYLQCEDFQKAREYFIRAIAVSEAVFEMPDLRIARVLELYAIAESAQTTSSKDKEQLECALSCLESAFAIRYELQGPEHIDTVETLSRIGRVQLRQRQYAEAKECYYEVLKLREAIFGDDHPSVAHAARLLAVAHTRLYQGDLAKRYFEEALTIYERNGLGGRAFADVVRKDIEDLKAMKVRCEV